MNWKHKTAQDGYRRDLPGKSRTFRTCVRNRVGMESNGGRLRIVLPVQLPKVKVPPIKIQGIKTKLLPFIASSVSWDGRGTYYEPFMGSGVVGFNLAPRSAVFSDTNPYIIEFYSSIQRGELTSPMVRDFLEREAPKLAATPEDKTSYYYEVRDRFNREHSPLDFLFLQRSNFNGMLRFNGSGRYNVPFGRKPQRFAPALITKIANQVAWVEDLLHQNSNWVFKVASFEEALSEISAQDFVYLDPPYVGRYDGYFDSWSEQKAEQLCTLMQASHAGYALSMWDENRYRRNEHLDLWDLSVKRTTEHFYHVGARETNRNSMTEALMISPNHAVADPSANFVDVKLEVI